MGWWGLLLQNKINRARKDLFCTIGGFEFSIKGFGAKITIGEGIADNHWIAAIHVVLDILGKVCIFS